ncbi:unnamed protein product [Rotaria sp. Silwood1]|nr:unnamed protein product [Rotaria sp. Silwood1]
MEFPTILGLSDRAGILRGAGVAWPNGIVPYIFATGYSYEQELIITAAMRMLENTVAMNNYRCVQFRPRNLSDPYYIIFYNGNGCSSYVGQNPGMNLNRTVTLQVSGCLGVGTIMHELLHALGFEHEQSRPDRDQYVTINWANIQTGIVMFLISMSYNFDRFDNDSVNTYNTPYDYGSLMHYSSTAFSTNGLPTIVANQANVTLGQRSNLSVYDVQALRRFYNCTASGTTLPPTTTPPPLNVSGVNTTYSSAWTTNSRKFLRYGGRTANYYYETYQVNVSTAGYYRFKSSSSIDTYGYLYVNNFLPSSTSLNFLVEDDDTGSNSQFQFTLYLQPNTVYILVATTYYENVTGSYTVIASGATRVTLVPVTNTSTVLTTTSAPATTSTSTYPPNTTITSYSGVLNNTSPTFYRTGNSNIFYFEAIKVTTNITGNYTFISNSGIDSFGYLCVNSFNPSNVASTLVALDDDSGGNAQFSITYTLQAGTTYILIFTTYSPNVTTSFSIMALGPARLGLQYIKMSNGSGSITTITSTSTIRYSTLTTTAPVICNGSSIRLTCPVQVVTNGIIVTINATNRTLNGGYITPNNTVFNLDDSSTVNGYVRTVSVQYVQSRLPTASTRIWIYGIIPILGGYMACSQYLVPSSQISTTQLGQTYNITANIINVFPGTYVGVGIQDGLTSIATTSGSIAFSVGTANLTSNIFTRTPLYFRPDNSGFGAKVSYTIMA